MSTLRSRSLSAARGRTGSARSRRSGFSSGQEAEDLDVELLDLRDYPLPFFEEAMPPGMAKDGYTNPTVVKWRDKIRGGRRLHHLHARVQPRLPGGAEERARLRLLRLGRKAVAFVSWGGAGGARGVEQLRPVAIELDMAPTRFAVHIPNPWFIKDIERDRHRAEQQSRRRCSITSPGGPAPSRPRGGSGEIRRERAVRVEHLADR